MIEPRSTFFVPQTAIGSPQDSPAKLELHVLLAAPRGFCAGVRRAIDAVRDALARHGAPIYVRRPIVHNLEVVRTLEAEGAIFVEELEEVPEGAVVIFSAHGVAPAIAADARQRNLIAYDAVCPLVAKVHREVERHDRDGRSIILVGHAGHPEIEGTLGHVPGARAFVVSDVDEVPLVPLRDDEPVAYAVQTTYSVDEAAAVIAALSDRFSDLIGPPTSDICYATTNRQAAVRQVALQADAIIIVGEHFSSNACRLAELAARICPLVQLVARAEEIDWSAVPAGGTIGISAAASTPDISVQGIVEALSVRFRVRLEEVGVMTEPTIFKRMALA